MPCSIWMPPWASGPVFTVSRPILTGFCCANPGAGSVAASAAPTRNERRLTLTDIASPFPSPRVRRLERHRLVGQAPPDRHVAQPMPDAIHLGQHRLVGLMDVDRIRGGHPAGPAGEPEHLRAIAFGIEEVATDGAGMVDD